MYFSKALEYSDFLFAYALYLIVIFQITLGYDVE